jgi:hypothetical protein
MNRKYIFENTDSNINVIKQLQNFFHQDEDDVLDYLESNLFILYEKKHNDKYFTSFLESNKDKYIKDIFGHLNKSENINKIIEEYRNKNYVLDSAITDNSTGNVDSSKVDNVLKPDILKRCVFGILDLYYDAYLKQIRAGASPTKVDVSYELKFEDDIDENILKINSNSFKYFIKHHFDRNTSGTNNTKLFKLANWKALEPTNERVKIIKKIIEIFNDSFVGDYKGVVIDDLDNNSVKHFKSDGKYLFGQNKDSSFSYSRVDDIQFKKTIIEGYRKKIINLLILETDLNNLKTYLNVDDLLLNTNNITSDVNINAIFSIFTTQGNKIYGRDDSEIKENIKKFLEILYNDLLPQLKNRLVVKNLSVLQSDKDFKKEEENKKAITQFETQQKAAAGVQKIADENKAFIDKQTSKEIKDKRYFRKFYKKGNNLLIKISSGVLKNLDASDIIEKFGIGIDANDYINILTEYIENNFVADFSNLFTSGANKITEFITKINTNKGYNEWFTKNGTPEVIVEGVGFFTGKGIFGPPKKRLIKLIKSNISSLNSHIDSLTIKTPTPTPTPTSFSQSDFESMIRSLIKEICFKIIYDIYMDIEKTG